MVCTSGPGYYCLLGHSNVTFTPLGPTSQSPNTPKVEKSTPQGVQVRPCKTPKSAKRNLGDPESAPMDQKVEKLSPWLPQVSHGRIPSEPHEPKNETFCHHMAGKIEPKPWRVDRNHTSAVRRQKIQENNAEVEQSTR